MPSRFQFQSFEKNFFIRYNTYSNIQAFDLLKKMLEIDPSKRPSAVDCLSHDFFIENDVQPVEISQDQNITESLKNFKEK